MFDLWRRELWPLVVVFKIIIIIIIIIIIEVVEWSEHLRSVTSVWLGPARRSVSNPTLHQRVYEREKVFGVISPPRDLLPSIIIIIIKERR